MLATNNMIAEALATNYGRRVIEDLHSILSNPKIKTELDLLRKDLNLKVDPLIDDKFVDQYLADSILNASDSEKGEHNTQDYVEAIEKSNNLVRKILSRNGITETWLWPMKVYLVKETVDSLSAMRNMISVEMDKSTKELTIKINPLSRNKKDLVDVASIIYNSWNNLRTVPNKRQRTNYAERDSEITRYKDSHSYKDTSDKFNLDVDQIKHIVSRQRHKASDIL